MAGEEEGEKSTVKLQKRIKLVRCLSWFGFVRSIVIDDAERGMPEHEAVDSARINREYRARPFELVGDPPNSLAGAQVLPAMEEYASDHPPDSISGRLCLAQIV